MNTSEALQWKWKRKTDFEMSGKILCVRILLITVLCMVEYQNAETLQSNLIGFVKEDIKNIDGKITKLKDFAFPDATGVVVSTHSDIIIQSFGVYFISCQLLVATNSTQRFSLEINIDDEKHSSFQSIGEISGIVPVSVNGIFKANPNTKLQIFITSKQTVSVLKNSRVSLTLLSRLDRHRQAFTVRMTPRVLNYKINRLKEVSFQLWSEIGSVASFIDTNLFVLANGYLVAACDCVFIVVINMIVASKENQLCKHSVVLKRNDRQIIGVQNQLANPMTWSTISFVRFVKLNRNDRVWFEVSSTCIEDVRVLPESTFSMSELSSGFEGLSLGLSEYLAARQGWFTPDLTTFKASLSGGYFSINSNLELSQTYLTVTTSGWVFVAINIELNIPKANGNVILAVTKNLFLDGSDVIEKVKDPANAYWVKQSTRGGDSTFASIQLYAKFNVSKMDLLRIYLNIPNNGKWLIMKNSSLSISVYPHQHNIALSPSTNPIKLSREWQLLPDCINVTSEYLTQLSDKFVGVTANGIYQVIVDFEVDDSESEEDIALALIVYIRNKKHVILYTKEKEVSFKKTFKLASSVRFHTGNRFGIFIRSNGPALVQSTCRTQIQYLGDQHSMIGFQANLKNDFTIQGHAGYFNINNFQDYQNDKDSKQQNMYYNTGDVFDMQNGVFTAPSKSTYLVSAIIVVNEVIMTSSENYVAVIVKINKKESALFNLKQQNLIHRGGSSVRNSSVSFCVSGAVHLNAHDKVILEVFVKSDDRWSIDRRSSFSIVLLSHRGNGLLVYRPSNRLAGSGGDTLEVAGWEASDKPPPYGMFVGSTHDTPAIQNGKQILFTRTGLYIISVNILLTYQDNAKEVALKLVRETSQNQDQEVSILCDQLKITYKVLSTSCQIVRTFQKDDVYYLQVASTSAIDTGDFYDEQSNDQNMAFLSVVLLDDVVNFQAGHFQLKKDFEYSVGSNTIKPWRPVSMLSTIGNAGFDGESGSLHIRGKGWFLFTVTVQCNRFFGNATLDLMRLGDTPGKSLITSKGECHSKKQSLSLSGIQYLSDNENVHVELSGFGGGNILASHSQLSFSYLKWKTIHRYYINSRTTFFLVGDKKYFKQPLSWSLNLEDKTPAVSSLSFKEAGVYLITANVIIATNSSHIALDVKVNDGSRLTVRTLARHDQYRRTSTITFTGVVVLRRGNADITINLESNTDTTIQESSTVSVAALVERDHVEHPVIVLRIKKRARYQRWRIAEWRLVKEFSLEALSKFYIENTHTAIPVHTGYYLLSCSIIVGVSKASYATLSLWLNDEIAIQAKEYVASIDTITISKVVYVRQGSRLALRIWHSSKDGGYTVEEGSTWSMLLLDSPRGTGDTPMLPVITNDLIVGNNIPVQGDEELYCDITAPDKYSYVWYFNNTVLKDETSYALHPNKYFNLGSGRYQCQAIAEGNGIGPLSRSAFIKIKAINECDRTQDICIGDGSRCTDNLVGYTCECIEPGYKYVHRKGCVFEEEIRQESSFPLLILILVVCFTIVIVLACSLYICMKRRQNHHREDPERRSVVGAENSDDITMQSLNNSVDYSEAGTLERPSRNGSLMSTADDSTLLVRSSIRNGGGCNAKKEHHTRRSFHTSRHHDSDQEEDADGSSQHHNWKILNNTQV